MLYKITTPDDLELMGDLLEEAEDPEVGAYEVGVDADPYGPYLGEPAGLAAIARPYEDDDRRRSFRLPRLEARPPQSRY
jgi:hypothetical protein